MDEDDKNEEVEWDTGTYCEHWCEPQECEELCQCGHMCKQHPMAGCNVEGCVCQEFKNKQEDQP
jgi:hypothetical protein